MFTHFTYSVSCTVRKNMATANEPGVVKFAFTNFSVVNENKWTAKCSHCSEAIKETRGTSSGFTKHLERKHAAVYERYKNSKGMLFIRDIGDIHRAHAHCTTVGLVSMRDD